jgi:hypothetical protein
VRGLRVVSPLFGFSVYELMLFAEMLADHGFSGTNLADTTRQFLGREPQSLDVALKSYYAAQPRTPWADSTFDTLLLRGS